MFKRFIKAVVDTAKKVWEFIKNLFRKKPKPEPIEEEPEDVPPDDKPWEPEGEEDVIPVEEASGVSLKEAKEYYEELQRNQNMW